MCAIKEPGVSFYLKTEEILYFLYDIEGLCGPKGRWHAIGRLGVPATIGPTKPIIVVMICGNLDSPALSAALLFVFITNNKYKQQSRK